MMFRTPVAVGKTVVLENAGLRAEFDEYTGALVGLLNKQTGWQIIRRPEFGLSFRMLIPLDDRRNNLAHGLKQSTPPQVTVSPDGNAVTFHWATVESEFGGVHPIAFTATITLGEDGLTFNGTIKNDSDRTVEALRYPCIGDLTGPGADRKLHRISMGYATGAKSEVWPNLMLEKGQWGVDYNTTAEVFNGDSLFLLIADEDQGFYLGYHDEKLTHMVGTSFELQPGFKDYYHLTVPHGDAIGGTPVVTWMNVVHHPFTNPGETQEMVPIVIQPYVGTWHAGVDLYKQWRATWFQRPTLPDWVTKVHAWHQYQVSGAEDDLRIPFRQMGETLLADAVKHHVKAIQLVGWNHGGQDRGNPFHDPDPRLGTPEDLAWFIAEAKQQGVNVILFSKFTWLDRSLDWFKRDGVKFATKDPYGDYHVNTGCQYLTDTQLADINTRRHIPACHMDPGYRTFAAGEVQKMLNLGAPGMLYDEIMHHGSGTLCFDPNHGHHVPAHNFAGDLLMNRGFRAVTDPVDPDFLYAGEHPSDVNLQVYQLVYFRFAYWSNMHLHRYIDPFLPMMPGVFGYDDRNMVNKCLQYRYIISYEPLNFKGRLDLMPLTLAYGKNMDALRTRYQDYLWDAEFRDSLGATVTGANTAFNPLDYAVYHRQDGKRAVVVCNVDDDNPVTVTVSLDGGATGPLMLVDAENPEMRPTDGTLTIPSRCAWVVIEQ